MTKINNRMTRSKKKDFFPPESIIRSNQICTNILFKRIKLKQIRVCYTI